jgi:hypothetical protein
VTGALCAGAAGAAVPHAASISVAMTAEARSRILAQGILMGHASSGRR